MSRHAAMGDGVRFRRSGRAALGRLGASVAHELRDTVRIPHWDYDGGGPEAREAWEREETNRTMDHQARSRRAARDVSWSIAQMVDGLECVEESLACGEAAYDLAACYAQTRALCEVWTSQP